MVASAAALPFREQQAEASEPGPPSDRRVIRVAAALDCC